MSRAKSGSSNRYSKLIEAVFFKHYGKDAREVLFERTDIVEAAQKLKIALPKNLGDVVYSFRYRTELPRSVTTKDSKGHVWVIVPAGRSRYKFEIMSVADDDIAPS